MTLGWVLDRPKKINEIMWHIVKNDLRLPLELPQVTSKTPNDDQKKSNKCNNNQHISHTNSTKWSNLTTQFKYFCIIHGHLCIIHGNFEKPFVCSFAVPLSLFVQNVVVLLFLKAKIKSWKHEKKQDAHWEMKAIRLINSSTSASNPNMKNHMVGTSMGTLDNPMWWVWGQA